MQKKPETEPVNNIFVTWQFWAAAGLAIVVVVLITAGFTQGNLFQGMLQYNGPAISTATKTNAPNAFNQTSGSTPMAEKMQGNSTALNEQNVSTAAVPSVFDLKQMILDLTNQVNTLKGQISSLQQNDSNLYGKMNDLAARVSALETQHYSAPAQQGQGKVYSCSCNGATSGTAKCCNQNDSNDCYYSTTEYCAPAQQGSGTRYDCEPSTNLCCNMDSPYDCYTWH